MSEESNHSNHVPLSFGKQKISNEEIQQAAKNMKVETIMSVAYHRMGFTAPELHKYFHEGQGDGGKVCTIILKKWRAHHPGRATLQNFQEHMSETVPDYQLPEGPPSSPQLHKRISKSFSELPSNKSLSVFKPVEFSGNLSMPNGTGSSTPDVRIGQYGKLYSMDTEELKREVRNLIVKQETSDKEMHQMRRQTKETQDRVQRLEQALYQQQAEIQYLQQLLSSGNTAQSQSPNNITFDGLYTQSLKLLQTTGEIKLSLNNITKMINDQRMSAKEAHASCNNLETKVNTVSSELNGLELTFNGLQNKQSNQYSATDHDYVTRIQETIHVLHQSVNEVKQHLQMMHDRKFQRLKEDGPINQFHDVPQSVKKTVEVKTTLDRQYIQPKTVRATEL